MGRSWFLLGMGSILFCHMNRLLPAHMASLCHSLCSITCAVILNPTEYKVFYSSMACPTFPTPFCRQRIKFLQLRMCSLHSRVTCLLAVSSWASLLLKSIFVFLFSLLSPIQFLLNFSCFSNSYTCFRIWAVC